MLWGVIDGFINELFIGGIMNGFMNGMFVNGFYERGACEWVD